jgi:Tol biopolymer transport system component
VLWQAIETRIIACHDCNGEFDVSIQRLGTLWLLVAVAAIASCDGGSEPAVAVTPPRDVRIATNEIVFGSDRTGNREIFVMKADGSGVAQQLTNDRAYEHWWPRISPDRSKVLFYRRPAAVRADDYSLASLWVMNADGSLVTQLIPRGAYGWTMQGHAEWSPDGSQIAMFGSAAGALEIFVTDATGKNPSQYTRRGGINTDVSWSPNGSQLLFNGCAGSPCTPARYEIFVMPARALAPAVQLTNDNLADYDPYFSPDGKSIAWLTTTDPSRNGGLGTWGIRASRADGSEVRNLIDDGNINSKPAWALDGQSLFFHRLELGASAEAKFGVFRINVDGSGLKRLTPVGSGVNEFPAN